MSFLLMVFLTLVCLYEQYPPPPWRGSPDLAVGLTTAVVLLVGGHAWWVSLRVTGALGRDPSLREEVLARYERGRFVHLVGQLVLFAVVLGVVGWGWAVRLLWRADGRQLPGVELVTLLPFLAGQVISWGFFYDAERAAQRSARRLPDAGPLAYPGGGDHALVGAGREPVPGGPAAVSAGEARLPGGNGRWAYIAFQFRQKLALVSIPVLLIMILKECLRLFPPEWQEVHAAVNAAGLLVLACAFLGMPWLIRLMLGLKPLPEGVLRDRLRSASRRLGFRCSDILLWNTQSGMANALVVGLVPWLRYVVFTDRLIEQFPEEEVEAVFGHEVGHVRHQHMLFYLVFLTLSVAVLGMLVEDYVLPLLGLPAGPAGDSGMFPVVGVVLAYVFVVFGFVSRRCERQADVFGCRAVSCADPHCLHHPESAVLAPAGRGLCPTGIRTFVRALEKVAHVNGISRDRPGFLQSWQHSTIARRVAFLQGVLLDARTEARFQRRLRVMKWGMLLVLAAALAVLLAASAARKPAPDGPAPTPPGLSARAHPG